MLNFYRKSIYDHEIFGYINKSDTKYSEWIIKEISSKDDSPHFKLLLNIGSKKFIINSVCFTGSLNEDIKTYSLDSIKRIIEENVKYFTNEKIQSVLSVIPLIDSNLQSYTDILNKKPENYGNFYHDLLAEKDKQLKKNKFKL